jgi:hypothetical protein
MISVERHAILTRGNDMARSIGYLLSLFPLGLLMPGMAAGQTAVEAGLGAGRGAISTAPAAGIGKAMNGLAGGLHKTVKAGQGPAAGAVPATAVRIYSSAKKAAPAASKWEDAGGIQTGLGYAELVRRFGPPAIEITGETGKSLTYLGKAGTFQLQVRDDKVASIDKPKS